MHCAYCGRENEERLEFCAECGSPLRQEVHDRTAAAPTTFARSYSLALCASLVIQAACLAFCATRFLQFTHRMFMLAFVFYWIGFLAVVLPRPRTPSAWRLGYVTLGFLAWFVAAVFTVPLVYGEGG
jgi:hypothetical protein